MSVKLEIDNKELQKLNKQFKNISVKVNRAGGEGLEKAGMQIGEDAQRTLKTNNNYATGKLINSLKIKKDKDEAIIVEFEAKYAYWIEFGRKAGKIPPIKPILEWIKKKGIADTYNIKSKRQTARGNDFLKRATSLAFAIAKSIGKLGYKARPFLYPAFRKNEQEVIKVIGDSIKKVL